MKYVLEPPRMIAGLRLRALVAVEASAHTLPGGGLLARGGKVPVAIILGSGARAIVLDLAGQPRDPAIFGLTPAEIA